ncbi:MAG: hypothetical protein ACREXM_14505 [Gammaproteobacteria bacterium]
MRPCGGEFAPGDSPEQGDVVGIADPQCSHAAVVIGEGLGNVVEYLMQMGCVLHGGECFAVGVIGALGGFFQAVTP